MEPRFGHYLAYSALGSARFPQAAGFVLAIHPRSGLVTYDSLPLASIVVVGKFRVPT